VPGSRPTEVQPARARAKRQATSDGVPPTVFELVGVTSDECLHPRADAFAPQDDGRAGPLHRLRQHVGLADDVVATFEAERVGCQQAIDDGDLFFESLPAAIDIVEPEPEACVLFFPPSRAHADLDPSAADVIDGRGRLREQGRLTERHGRHERSQTERAGSGGEGAEQRPGVGGSSPAHAVRAEVVVGAEQTLEAEVFTGLGQPQPVGPRHALLALDHHAEPHPGSVSAVPDETTSYLSEGQRALRAVLLGLALGLVLVVLRKRSRPAPPFAAG